MSPSSISAESSWRALLPVFAACAAIGLQVLGTFSVGQSSFVVGGMQVAAGSELDGLQMGKLSSRTRVIAICREDAPIDLRPHHEAQLRGGDTVYLVGPYRDLVATLRKGLPPKHAVAGPERAGDGDQSPQPQQDADVSRQARTG